MLIYKQMSSHYTSRPEKGEPYGTVHTVEIENNKGTEEHDVLGKTGKVLKHKSKSLTKRAIQAILSPKTRKSKTRKSTRHHK
jgi:hypothetical protein